MARDEYGFESFIPDISDDMDFDDLVDMQVEYDLIHQEMLDAFSGNHEAEYIRMQGDPVEDYYAANYKPTLRDRMYDVQQWLKRLPGNLYWKAYGLKCRVHAAIFGEVEVPF